MKNETKILVTGATGFIGGRLVERLAREGRPLRIVTSDLRRCARVARFPVELVRADLADATNFARTVEGCDLVFHLAYRFGGSAAGQLETNLAATRALAEAAIDHGVRRFIHFSSVAAYGAPADGDVTEDTQSRPARDPYSDTKRRLDEMLRDLNTRRGLPLTILQPTIVYGPYGGTWTVPILSLLRTSHIALPASDSGLCNAVYVDDVVTAAILASQCDAAVGESFLVSAADPVSWRQYYAAYEQMLGTQAVVAMDDAEIRAESERMAAGPGPVQRLQQALARRPEIRERLLARPPQSWAIAGGRFLPLSWQQHVKSWYAGLWELPPAPATPTFIPDPATLALYSARTRVRIDKARTKLGYVPAFDLQRGMAMTALWARWANLLP